MSNLAMGTTVFAVFLAGDPALGICVAFVVVNLAYSVIAEALRKTK